ncbi:hypothetical protein HH214_12065 [Mucilaginibacter robiniae]|uniref:Uncharacterized protein n=1 Tax=Mucilaginibacter robiniae TaxID=2728022 RepID=A0A7L5DZL9_9SPHI|nr:hypothetical protein [Mucilaginibacter robiniae]QJD96560.1 hypothetical protein HH214_12065 [Mucilaginibacter robiniae]
MQPYYQIDFSAASCQFEASVNDIPVFTLSVAGQASTMVPINPGIFQSGKQKLSIKLLPLPGELSVSPNAEFKYNIKVFDVNHSFTFKEQLPGYEFPPVDASKYYPVLTHESIFMADVPYTIQAFQNATDLRTMPDLKEQVRAAYQQVADLIDQAAYDRFKAALANREQIMSTTMYLNKQESDARLQELITDFQSGFKVEALPLDAVVHLYANGKIAALKKPNGESALTLIDKKTGEELTIELSVYLPQGKTTMEVI